MANPKRVSVGALRKATGVAMTALEDILITLNDVGTFTKAESKIVNLAYDALRKAEKLTGV